MVLLQNGGGGGGGLVKVRNTHDFKVRLRLIFINTN